MPFIPHTPDDVRVMLDAIGVPTLEALFDEVPPALRVGELLDLPDALNEPRISRLMAARAADYPQPSCFLGAGAYEHHIPVAVWDIAGRGEFYSAYTPYQPEASQGTLQVLYEYQRALAAYAGQDFAALAIPQPNFFGVLEDTAATLYLSLLGPRGLEQVAAACHANTRALVERLTQIPGVSRAFDRPVFHEAVLKLPRPASEMLEGLLARGILGGFDLSDDYPELGNSLLICATETKEEADLRQYATALAEVV